MPQFFVKDEDFEGSTAIIRGEDLHHLKNVRRVNPGEIVRIRVKDGTGYTARVESLEEEGIRLSVIENLGISTEPVSVDLYAALLKGESFEFVLQKAVEIGVHRIVPVSSSRTVPDISGKYEKKMERWKRIMSGAAKQCLRGTVPLLGELIHFDAIPGIAEASMKLIAHPGAPTELRDLLSSSDKPERVSLLVGPEGGFSDDEILSASEKGWFPVNFGTTHMRAETAALVLPALILYQWS